ncbi:MAG: restriction endonuclease subunit S [Candidatus Thiodiazotropha sp. (ex Ustalcina ferruginea)]|nr:restriction endonuclease subunit S [Candidatus Thiodiazotropha sp. (ex Ustalcina ferruginea)]
MVPEGWHIYKLGDLGCGSRPAVKAGPFGSSLKKYFYVSEGYKIYGQEQVIKNDAFYGDYFINEGKFAELESCSVLPGDILVSLVGTLGKILLIPNNASKDIINPRLIRISPDKNKTEPLYLKYYLEDKWTQNLLLRRAQGGTMGVLNAGVFKSLPLLLPPLCEQFEIAQILSTWDKAIETTEKLIDNSKAQRKALMQQLLTGKRRFPEFSNKWVKTRLCYIAYINPCKPEKPEDEQVSFVSMDSVSEHARLLRFENRQYSEVEKGFTSFINNDVLVAKITPCFENGKGAYAKELTNGIGFGSTEFHVIRAKNGICSKLIYHITNSFEFRFHGRANMQGSAGHKRVPTDYLRLYKFYWPVDFKEQTKIANMLDTVASEIEFLSNETAALTNQKKALMQQLLTGKYRVKVDNLRTTEVTA